MDEGGGDDEDEDEDVYLWDISSSFTFFLLALTLPAQISRDEEIVLVSLGLDVYHLRIKIKWPAAEWLPWITSGQLRLLRADCCSFPPFCAVFHFLTDPLLFSVPITTDARSPGYGNDRKECVSDRLLSQSVSGENRNSLMRQCHMSNRICRQTHAYRIRYYWIRKLLPLKTKHKCTYQ